MNEITLHISGLADIPAAADAIAGAMQAAGASVVAFDGEMGAGMTTAPPPTAATCSISTSTALKARPRPWT